ncbi:MAG: 4Fe-4S dicluster domain-containing protein [Chloroflexota bacterium]|nr:MAG: 4Fe-4S dicluster domain-containing protein [Chloroflexota bacterium]
MQLGFYFDQTRCTACFACVVACKDWHSVPPGPASWRRVTSIEKGNYPNLFVAHLSEGCHHCANPACTAACPADAITKREADGIVVVDQEACLGRDGCGLCLDACPWDCPQFGPEVNAKMQKCDFCVDRLAEGKAPICAASCPMRALEAGPLAELRARYPVSDAAEGFVHDATTNPSILFKAKHDAAGLPISRVDHTPTSPATERIA